METPAASTVTDLLRAAQSARVILQDYVPLANSLEWEIGAQYFARQGSLAFLSEHIPVPYAVNNSGTLSRKAADLVYTAVSAESSVDAGTAIVVLELGIGLGLFARYFLDAFRLLSMEHKTDYYNRLLYVAADYSEQMLLDVVRRGVFQNHPGRYLLRVVDASNPRASILRDPLLSSLGERPLRAVFLNYVLDCLPATVLKTQSTTVDGVTGESDATGTQDTVAHQLCVRTCLARGVDLREYTDLSAEDTARLATSQSPDARRQLLDLFGLFTSEYIYRPVRIEDLPDASFIRKFAREHPGLILYNHGAIAALRQLLDLLAPSGVILINDYGTNQPATSDEFEHQRYGRGSFVGLNFALLKAVFSHPSPGQARAEAVVGSQRVAACWAEPPEDSPRIYSRLVGHELHPSVVATFQRNFGKAPAEHLEEPARRAKAHLQQGQFEAAASAYRLALERQPWDWLLILEVANFLTSGLRDPKTGLALAKAGLGLNPFCSPELWNAYGDALFSLGRIGQAKHAYERALAVNPEDVQARYNLAWVYLHRKQHAEALRVIGEAFARDWRGVFRERLQQKQDEVLIDLARRAHQEYHTLVNRISQHPSQPDARGEGPVGPPPVYNKGETFKPA